MIYFIQDNGTLLIKIGYTSASVEDRRDSGLTWCPYGLTVLATMNGNFDRESELHEQFKGSHVDGEWFRPTPGLLTYLLKMVHSTVSSMKPQVEAPPVPPQGKLQLAIIEYLESHPGSLAKEVGVGVNASRQTVRTVLHRLLGRGIVRRDGPGWWLSEEQQEVRIA